MVARIELDIDGARVDVPALWLRLQCRCPECEVGGVGERWVLPTAEPAEARPVTITANPGSLEVVWPSGHRSVFEEDDLARFVDMSRRRTAEPVRTWSGDHSPHLVDHATALADPSVAVDALDVFAAEGVMIVTGMPEGRGSVERFLASMGAGLRHVPFGRIHEVEYVPGGYNVALTSDALPPHTDLASYSWPPSGQALHMLRNDAAGGDSIVLDGWNALEELRSEDPAGFAVLAEVAVPHRIFSGTGETYARQPIVRTDPDGTVVGIRYSNQTLQPLPLDEPRIDEWYRAYRRLTTMIMDPARQHRRRLDAGDMLVVHGHRVLHGRTAFSGEEASRHLQTAYFEFDDLLATRDRLSGAARS